MADDLDDVADPEDLDEVELEEPADDCSKTMTWRRA